MWYKREEQLATVSYWYIMKGVQQIVGGLLAYCFSEERQKANGRTCVRSNQTGVQNRRFKKEQMFEAFMNPQMWCYWLIAICTTVPTSGLRVFANVVISGFHFSVLQTQLLSMSLGGIVLLFY